jgi:uncharacterized protein
MPDHPTLDPDFGKSLLTHARTAIATRLDLPAPPTVDHPALHAPGASFVTLTRHGQLRGCIGHLHPIQALGPDVRENAIAAAFHDPRFIPLTAAEWPDLSIEVSVLGPSVFSPCPTEEDCLRQIVPFQDGVILASSSRHATFLPQVWEQLPDPQDFIAHLLQKAGLPVTLWPSDMQLGRYQVAKYKEF